MKHFVGDWNEKFFSPGSRVRIYSNESTKREFECWVYHFELNNPRSAVISYSNKSMKREIWKLNLKTRKKKSFHNY